TGNASANGQLFCLVHRSALKRAGMFTQLSLPPPNSDDVKSGNESGILERTTNHDKVELIILVVDGIFHRNQNQTNGHMFSDDKKTEGSATSSLNHILDTALFHRCLQVQPFPASSTTAKIPEDFHIPLIYGFKRDHSTTLELTRVGTQLTDNMNMGLVSTKRDRPSQVFDQSLLVCHRDQYFDRYYSYNTPITSHEPKAHL
ncbi:hypothetical protein J6590_104378, partial [Homalodisca vitripennis]